MSRKRIYNISDFSGGITDQIRNTNDLSRCAHVSHFDIYRDPNKMYPMPGYIDDMNDGSTATGMKSYGLRAFMWTTSGVWGVGTKSNGTGWKLVKKDAITDAAWDLTPSSTTMEGTYTLYPNTFLTGDASNQFFITTNGGSTYLTRNNGATPTENYDTLHSYALSATSAQTVADKNPNETTNLVYATKADQNILSIDTDTPASTDDVKTTGIRVNDIAPGDDQLGIFGYRTSPHTASLVLWDYDSLLIDQHIPFGRGDGAAIGFVNGVWIGIVDENLTTGALGFSDESNGLHSFSVKYPSGGQSETITRVFGATNTNAVLKPTRSKYRDAMLFYARVPTNSNGTTFKGGVWAVGTTSTGRIALSQLLDTEDLGSVQALCGAGSHFLFAHAGDGSISRLDNISSGTYDVEAVYESLIFGADTPNHKNLNGISVHTENLPASGSVVVKYRTDTDSSWTTLGTSSTTGTQIHNFTAVSGAPIGTFTEIQFRIEVLGNAPVKNIHISLEELDTTPYDS